MEKILNKPIANTFAKLGFNGTRVDVVDEVKKQELNVAAGETKLVVIDDSSVELRAEVGAGATLKLIQIRRGGEETGVVDVHVNCLDNAKFEWYRVVLGGDATYDNCSVELSGNESSFEAYVGYRLDGNEVYDGNVESVHTGKNTTTNITASGVLDGEAYKMLKSTIDFRRGCKGASGAENEDVLLMSETVKNKSLPVILCSEEDVDGQHGASIGRLDEGLVFYLESRGLSTESVYELMAAGKLNTIIRKIPDEEIRNGLE